MTVVYRSNTAQVVFSPSLYLYAVVNKFAILNLYNEYLIVVNAASIDVPSTNNTMPDFTDNHDDMVTITTTTTTNFSTNNSHYWMQLHLFNDNGWHLAGILAVMQFVLFISLGVFIGHRHLPGIYYRNIPLTMASIIATGIVLSWCVIRILFYRPLHCAVELWLGGSMLLVLMFISMGRYARLLIFFICCEAHLHTVEVNNHNAHWAGRDQPNETIEFINNHRLYNIFVVIIRWNDRLRYKLLGRQNVLKSNKEDSSSRLTIDNITIANASEPTSYKPATALPSIHSSFLRNRSLDGENMDLNHITASIVGIEADDASIISQNANSAPASILNGKELLPRIVQRGHLRSQSARPPNNKRVYNSASIQTMVGHQRKYGRSQTIVDQEIQQESIEHLIAEAPFCDDIDSPEKIKVNTRQKSISLDTLCGPEVTVASRDSSMVVVPQRTRRNTVISVISSSLVSTLFERQIENFNEFSPCIVLGSWYWRHRERQSFNAVSLMVVILVFIVIIITGTIHAIAQQTNSLPIVNEAAICLYQWPLWPFGLLYTILHCVIMPIMFQNLPKTRDGFGIRFELLLIIIGGIIAMAGGLVSWLIIPSYKQHLRTLCLLVPIAAYSIYVHFCTVIYPIIKERRAKRLQERHHDALTWDTFELLLGNPVQFELFKQFSKRDYSIENALFYEHCRRLRNNASSLGRTTLDCELRNIWHTFIEPTAPLQIHLDALTVAKLRRHIIDSGQPCTDVRILDAALLEICELMYQHTYPRFVAWESMKKRQPISASAQRV
ncbi:hypothetical protein BDF19DRAFT_493931 [Syncephalis fuscata]|nr:hypothetical protein BDF19DRAFT_493931 [Syncephalis fuscata]